MSKFVIRPTTVFARIGYCVCAGVWFGVVVLWYTHYRDTGKWILLLPLVLFLWPASAHLRQCFTKLTLENGRLSFESGISNRISRAMEVSRLVDVSVHQGLFQRMLSLGNLILQPEGETQRIEMLNVDSPRQAASRLLDEVRNQRKPDASQG